MLTTKTFRYAWKSRKAWWFTASSKTKERFSRTALGSLWLGVSNLISIAALSVVYGAVFKVENFNEYVVFLGTGLVAWGAVAGSVAAAPSLLKNNLGNIQNTNINPVFFVLEEWAFQVQTFAQTIGLVLIGLTFYQPNIAINLITVGLLPLINLLAFIYWMPLIVCLIGARYQDLFQFIPVMLQLMFLLSPLLYKKEALGKMYWIADINPLYRIVSNLRHALISGEAQLLQVATMLMINLIGVIISTKMLDKSRRDLPFIV